MALSSHFLFMEEALAEARASARLDEVPVGCVLVQGGRVIAKTGNRTRSLCDPTAHAEILALRQGAQHLQTLFLTDCDLYVTLEPGAMCAQALAWARIRHVYFGAYDPKSGGLTHGARVFDQPTCHHKPGHTGGLLEKETGLLLQTFFQDKRPL